MSTPYFMVNRIFSGKRGADCAYLFQNVIEAQSRHLRKWPRHGPPRRPEEPTMAGELARQIMEDADAYDWGNSKEWVNQPSQPHARDILIKHEIAFEREERRRRAKEALMERREMNPESFI